LPENSKKISLSLLLLSLIVAQVDEAAEATKDISLFVSPTGLDNEKKNCLTRMEQMDLSLSSFDRVSRADEPRARTERRRSSSLLLSIEEGSNTNTDIKDSTDRNGQGAKEIKSPMSHQEQNEYHSGLMNRSRCK
jgi:hypothetical protein